MVLLNEAKPKYEKLDELLNDYLTNIKYSNYANIVIDLKEILKKFFRPDIEVNSGYRKTSAYIEEISSDVINTIAHYRNYFYKHGKYTTFFILYSSKKCENILKNYSNYKREYYEKYFNPEETKVKIIERVVKRLEKIVPAIPHCFYIDTSNYDELVYAKYILSNICVENEFTLILSNDSAFYQLLSNNTVLLDLKGIRSSLFTKENCLGLLTKKEYNFSSNLIPLMLSFSGYKKYSIEGVGNIGTIKSANMVQHLLESKIIVDAESIAFPIELLKLNVNNKFEKKILENYEKIKENYNLITQNNLLYQNKSAIMLSFLVNHPSQTIKTFMELNSKIFSMYPLQLEMLFKGESV